MNFRYHLLIILLVMSSIDTSVHERTQLDVFAGEQRVEHEMVSPIFHDELLPEVQLLCSNVNGYIGVFHDHVFRR